MKLLVRTRQTHGGSIVHRADCPHIVRVHVSEVTPVSSIPPDADLCQHCKPTNPGMRIIELNTTETDHLLLDLVRWSAEKDRTLKVSIDGAGFKYKIGEGMWTPCYGRTY